MPRKSEISHNDMYEMWLACGQNATRAAEKLGMTVGTFHYHSSKQKFGQRYAAEFSGTAMLMYKMAQIELMNEWPDLQREMVSIVKDPEATNKDRTQAYLALQKSLPQIPENTQGSPMTYIEASGMVVDETLSPELSIEEQVREELESNIIDAQETRQRRNSSRG